MYLARLMATARLGQQGNTQVVLMQALAARSAAPHPATFPMVPGRSPAHPTSSGAGITVRGRGGGSASLTPLSPYVHTLYTPPASPWYYVSTKEWL